MNNKIARQAFGNPPANTRDIRDVGSIPGSGRSPGGRHGNSLQYLAWKIPWTEESGGLQSMGVTRVRHDLATKPSQYKTKNKEKTPI